MSIIMSGDNAIATLEPGVIYPGLSGRDQVTVGDTHIQLSIAISLKRLADVLASGSLEGLHGTITNMAWEAGRNFAAGQGTGR